MIICWVVQWAEESSLAVGCRTWSGVSSWAGNQILISGKRGMAWRIVIRVGDTCWLVIRDTCW